MTRAIYAGIAFPGRLQIFWRKLSTMATSRGALIVFEGCDRSGKTTQCQKLLKRLQSEGIPSELIKFPDRTTTIGQMINCYLGNKTELEDHAVHLLFSANRWESVPKMKKILDSGTTLIVDRYAFSGVAFTAAKKGFTIDWCCQADIGLPRPDTVLYLTLSSEAASKRGDFGDERYETVAFQKLVAQNFEKLSKMDDSWEVIDADRSVDEVHSQIYNITKRLIDKSKHRPLETLWEKKRKPLKSLCKGEIA
ncbi:thymidylate kinase-like isoform X2 [Gigantopelta aegis]|uniref:thymidylate kinase-like isoform X2 n=1 Tax=Gigantopelta aegis TaxID=1735272 RepID=UPI001B88E472|nr:thymidylate kinase-like isoform X2 [Gigantopelta aegis]